MSMLRSRFGIPGVIATIALVFAMTGGAFAAKYLITSTKQIKPSVLKALKGNTGPAGPQGPAGINGTNGTNGKDGAPGKDGEDGADGADGESVNVAGYIGPECPTEEGTEFSNASGTAYACNGEEGPEGSPWTAGGTLPTGSTETGSWFGVTSSEGKLKTPISFPIPLSTPGTFKFVPAGAGLTVTGETTSGSKVVKGSFANKIFGKGSLIEGTGIPAGTTVAKMISTSEFELSAEATATGTATLTGVAPAACDDGEAPAASPEHPEADSGFVCFFVARDEPETAVLAAGLKSGGLSAFTFGVSTVGALVQVFGAAKEKEIWGTFAVTG